MSSSAHGSSKSAWGWYALGVIGMPLLLAQIGLSMQQTLAVGGFCVVLFGAIFFWERRLAFACLGIALLLTTGLLDVPHFIEFAGLDIILFLIAMMTIIGFMEEKQFFEYVIEQLLEIIGPHPKRILVVLMIMAAVSAALVDEVTSILFMTAALLNLLAGSRVNPVPYLLMIIFATNIGSSATVVGNPVGVIIALRSGLTFADFLRWATPVSVICLAVTIPICLLGLFRRDVEALRGVLSGKRGERHIEHVVEDERKARRGVRQSGFLFGGVVLGLVLHHQLEHWLHLPPNTMLLGVALFGAGIALAMSGNQARQLMEKRVDWWTLTFFLLLFASVGTLKFTGVTSVVAQRIIELSGGSVPLLATLFVWSSGILTAVMDNVLAVATFVPVVSDVAATGINAFPLWWAMLFGGTLMGNATLIGSTANIVAVGLLERRNAGKITFGQWLKPGLTVAIITTVIANLLLLAQLSLMPQMGAGVLGPSGH